ncbi:MAG: hypothetical protein ACI9XO_001594 [Paraglaciecola sp.]
MQFPILPIKIKTMMIATDKQWIKQFFEELVLVEGGIFWMGDDDSHRKSEKARH